MNKFFCRTTSGSWECVTEWVWNERGKALSDSGNGPRYTQEGFCNRNGDITILGTYSRDDMGKILRMLGLQPFNGVVQTPLFDEPECVRFGLRKGSTILHYLKTGESFKSVAIKPAA